MVFTRAETLRALLLHIKSMRPRPPLWVGTDRDFRLTVSILDPHRKGKTSFLNREITHSGVGKTLERNQNLLAPRVLMISTFPTRDKERHFHKLILDSNLEILGSQLSGSTLTNPLENQTPQIFILVTHDNPRGVSGLDRQAPSHMASVLLKLSFAPVPLSNFRNR